DTWKNSRTAQRSRKCPTRMAMTSPENITLDLDQPGHRGVVISQHDGQIVFVRHGLPGEKRGEVALDPSHKNGKERYRMREVMTMDQPSPQHVHRQYDAAAGREGFCDIEIADDEAALDFQQSEVIDKSRRLGK